MPRRRQRKDDDSDDDHDVLSLVSDISLAMERSKPQKGGPAARGSTCKKAINLPESDVSAAAGQPSVPEDVECITYSALKKDQGMRIDQLLSIRLPGAITRGRVKRALKDGGVHVNGQVVERAAVKVKAGDLIEFRDAQRASPGFVLAEPIPLHIYHEDNDCIVLEKPAGMVVHPTGGLRTGTLVNALLHHVGCPELQIEDEQEEEEDASDDECTSVQSVSSQSEANSLGTVDCTIEACNVLDDNQDVANAQTTDGRHPETKVAALRNVTLSKVHSLDVTAPIVRPGIVHRLDRGTSGVMIVAKHDAAHSALAKQFGLRETHRTYVAILWGVPSPGIGRIEGNIGRDPGDRLRMTVVPKGKGKPAATNYQVLEQFLGTSLSLVQFRLETGRTHQIRVHARHIGHPLLGDAIYGGAQLLHGPQTLERKALLAKMLDCLPRPALHAKTLGFAHPSSGRWLSFHSELPGDMSAVLQLLGQ